MWPSLPQLWQCARCFKVVPADYRRFHGTLVDDTSSPVERKGANLHEVAQRQLSHAPKRADRVRCAVEFARPSQDVCVVANRISFEASGAGDRSDGGAGVVVGMKQRAPLQCLAVEAGHEQGDPLPDPARP